MSTIANAAAQNIESSDGLTVCLPPEATEKDLMEALTQYTHILGYMADEPVYEELAFVINNDEVSSIRAIIVLYESPQDCMYWLASAEKTEFVRLVSSLEGETLSSRVFSAISRKNQQLAETTQLPDAIAFLGYDWTLAEGF